MKALPHRVLLCCEQYPPSVGGVQEVMRQIAERLVRQGYDVTVATGTHAERGADAVINGVRVISFAISGNAVEGLVGPLDSYRKFLCNGGFDAVLIKAAQQWSFDAALDVMPQLIGRKVFIPCGFSRLGNSRYRKYFEQMPVWLKYFDELIFYASDYQDINFARQHGLKNLRVISNAVDEREFSVIADQGIRSRLGIPDEDDLLLSVGSRIAAKGHWEVLEAFRLARLARPTTLVINGNEPTAGKLPALKRTLKNALNGRWPLDWSAARVGRQADKQVLITDLQRPELLSLYAAADLFVFGSHVEYSPLVLFEAAAAGLPFISTSAGNSAEIAEWVGGGTIVAAKSRKSAEATPEALAAAMEQSLDDRESLRRIGQAMRRNVFDLRLVWEKVVQDYIEAIRL